MRPWMLRRSPWRSTRRTSAASGPLHGDAAGAGPLDRIAERLQRLYGNRYVQRLFAPEPASTVETGESPTRVLESAFAEPLDGVTVHSDAGARGRAERLGTKAFAQGDQIFLGERFDASDPRAVHVLAHEIAHVLQWRKGQGGGGPVDIAAVEADAARAARDVEIGRRPHIAAAVAEATILRSEDEGRPPTITRHPGAIGPLPPSGTLTAGALTIGYRYANGTTALILETPAGTIVTARALAEVGTSDIRVMDPGADSARCVTLTVPAAQRPPRIEVTFTGSGVVLHAVFSFEAAQPLVEPPPPEPET